MNITRRNSLKPFNPNLQMDSKKDCIIIGAGITGLTAAYYLKKAGKDFVVLEEKGRVGA